MNESEKREAEKQSKQEMSEKLGGLLDYLFYDYFLSSKVDNRESDKDK